MTTLKNRRQRFVDEYLVDLNATQAAIRAGYSVKTSKMQGSRLLTNDDVQADIADRQAKRAKKVGVTAEEVIAELRKLAFFDVRKFFDAEGRPVALVDLDDNTAAAVVGLEVLEEFDGAGADRIKRGEVKKYKLADKVKSLELLARHLGLLNDQLKVSGAPSLVAYLPGNGR